MGASKLKVLHVVIIGSVLCLVAVIVIYFGWISKTKAEIDGAQKKYKEASAIADGLSKAQADKVEAIADYAKVLVDYDKMMNQKMPPITLQDRLGGWMEYLHEMADVLGPKVEAWPKRTGVTLTNSISIPAGVADANQVPPDVIVVPLGTMTVTGSFAQIMAHIRSWNKFDRLVQVDPVSLSGNSPSMTGQYNLTAYIFPKGEEGPPVGMNNGGALADAAAALGGASGAMGGGGMPGMGPGGMKGGMKGMKGGMMKGMKGMGKGGMMPGGAGGPQAPPAVGRQEDVVPQMNKFQEWVNDKKNQPFIIGGFAALVVIILVIVFFPRGGGSPAQSTTTAAGAGPSGPPGMGGPGGMKGGMKGFMKGMKGGMKGMKGGFGGFGATQDATATAVATAVAAPKSKGPMLPYRKDPFVPLEGPPTRTKVLESMLPQVTNYNFPAPSKPIVLPWMPKKAEPAEVLPQQPFRRMAGVMIDDRISAVLETNGDSDIVVPGMEITKGNSRVRVESISSDEIVLKTLDTRKPMTIRVGLTGSVALPPAVSPSPVNQGAGGGANAIYPAP